MALKDEIRQENIKLKDMAFRKKAAYIWDYYKIHIIVTIAVIIFIITFVHDYRINKRPLYLDAIIINSDVAYSADNYFKDDYIRYSGVDTDTYNLAIDTGIIISEDSYDQMTTANIQKVMAMYAAGDLDVVIAPDTITDEYGAIGAHMDLSGVLTDDLKEELEKKGCEPYYTTVYEEDENGEHKPVEEYLAGVYLDRSEYLNTLGGTGAFTTQLQSGKRPVFTITATSQRTDHAIEFLKMLAGL